MDDKPTDRLANMYNYVCEKLVGTVYGPEEHLDAKLKPFRKMNYKEYDNYMKKVDESEGFDVDGCPGSMPGRITSVREGCSGYERAVQVAQHAAWKQGDAMGIPIDLVRLVKVNKQAVEGVLYYLTFVAITPKEMAKTYKAKVWVKPVTCVSEIILFLEETSDGNKDITVKRKVEKPRGRGKTMVEENVKFDLSHCFSFHIFQYISSAPLDESYRLETVGITNGQLQRDGFNLLVKELKMKNPQWKHAKAKRSASKIWKRGTGYPQKAPYLKEARKIYERQHPEYFYSDSE